MDIIKLSKWLVEIEIMPNIESNASINVGEKYASLTNI